MLPYGGTILPKNSLLARQKFGNRLVVPTAGLVEILELSKCHKIYESLPKQIKAMVIHRKVQFKENAFGTLDIDNVAVEVTLLGDFGNPMEEYTEVLFTPMCIHCWIVQNKNSLVTHLI